MVRLLPQSLCDLEWIDIAVHCAPPFRFIAGSMDLSMMGPTKRNREFVAHLAAHRHRLGVPQVVGIGRPSVAQQAGLRSDKFQVRLVSATPGATQESPLVGVGGFRGR